MIRLAIFDLDGTLLDTIADLGEACNHALRQHGFPTHDLDCYPKMVGNGVNKLLERALPEGHKEEETVLLLKQDFVDYYNEHNRIHTHPYEGIPEVLKALKENGIQMAVASNKYQEATRTLITQFFGENTFSIVLGERAGIARKPDPKIVLDILQFFEGIRPGEVLYIGDSDVDMQTAKNAGLASIGCTWGFCTREKLAAEHPDYLIDNAEEILQIALK